MNRNEILNGLRSILTSKLKIVSDPAAISENTDLIKDFNIDSMKIVSLLIELENFFGISLDADDISYETLTQMPKLVQYIEEHV